MIRSAYLRVYVPEAHAGAFERHTDTVDPRRRVMRASDHFVWEESTRNDAFTVEWEGRVVVCPRYPRLRMLEGVLAFQNAYPGMGSTLIPERTLHRAAEELEVLRQRMPDARSYILSSPWHVPLRWFAAFGPEDREVLDRHWGKTIRYRSLVGAARHRLERSLDVLSDAGFDDSVLEPLGDLVEWISEFTEDAMLELDYAGVAGLFSDGDLALDESAAEIEASLDALERGDFAAAGMYYAAVAGRWAAAQSLTYVN